ncbi:MAG TPA: hypothetical protein VKV73_08075, partial [Chloroflexota bacterium]|nr:hypothetical protein [Chloroflexota bacterium]
MRTLVHISDTHILPTADDQLYGVDTLRNVQDVLQYVVDSGTRADALGRFRGAREQSAGGLDGPTAIRPVGFAEMQGRRRKARKTGHFVPPAAEPVNPGETGRRTNYRVDGTSSGLLIQAGPGSGGGSGSWRTKRSGCA